MFKLLKLCGKPAARKEMGWNRESLLHLMQLQLRVTDKSFLNIRNAYTGKERLKLSRPYLQPWMKTPGLLGETKDMPKLTDEL